jgi:hypothetical protein
MSKLALLLISTMKFNNKMLILLPKKYDDNHAFCEQLFRIRLITK